MNFRKIVSVIVVMMMLVSTLTVGMTVNAEKVTFSDVTEDMWSYGDVMYAYENGLMNGTGGSTFSPAVGVTRGMVVTVLYRAEQSPITRFADKFIDVVEGQYYSTAVIWAFNNGIVNGTGTSEWGEVTFSPDRVITRQELATMFVRYAEYKGVITEGSGSLDKFTDKASVASWATDAMKWATSCGLINGTGSGSTLSPTMTASREQFAAIIHRFRTLEFEYKVKYNMPLVQSKYTEAPYPLVNDADIYVAVDGNDSNPGTLAKPLATFEAAAAKARELKKTVKGEIKIAFKAGDYGILSTKLTEEDSGSEGATITYCAYGDGEVYFTNGIYIPKSDFKALDESDNLSRFNQAEISNIMKVDLDTVPGGDKVTTESQLFSNGSFCNLARVPNKEGLTDSYYPGFTSCVVTDDSPYTLEEVIALGKAGTLTTDEMDSYLCQDRLLTKRVLKDKLSSYSSLEGVQLIGYISKVWHQDVFTISSFDKETGIVTYNERPLWGFYAMVSEQTTLYVNNVPEELDFENEYWIDHKTGTLYVYAPADSYYIAMEGTFVTTDYTDYVSFVNLNFRCTTDSPMRLRRSDNITIDRCSFTYSGGDDGFVVSESLDFTIKNSEIAYTSGYGIAFDGIYSTDRLDAGYDFMTLESQNIVIENNVFHDVSLVDIHSDVAAIKLHSFMVGVKIVHNEIYNASRIGVCFGDGNYDVLIEYNIFHHCMTNSGDGGAIHIGRGTVGPVNTIRYNLFYDIVETQVGGTYGIYLDDFEADNDVYGNIFYKVACPIVTNGGRDNNIHDNVSILSGRFFIKYDPDRILTSWKNGGEVYSQYSMLPDESSPYYEIWREKCASNYATEADLENLFNPKSIFVQNNTVVNNYFFDCESFEFDENIVKVGTVKDNFKLSAEENPVFTNPALGDYSIKAGAPIVDNHYAQIGRY